MKEDLKQRQVDSLLKASDLLMRLMSGDLKPVCLRQFKKDGDDIFVYAHANGTFELTQGLGDLTVLGKTLEQHQDICKSASTIINKFFEMKDELLKGKDERFVLGKHATILVLKETLEKSQGAVDVMLEHLSKGMPAPKGRKPTHPGDDTWKAEQKESKTPVARLNPFGHAKFYTDNNPDNDPRSGA